MHCLCVPDVAPACWILKNPNETTIPTFWKSASDAETELMFAIASCIKKVLGCAGCLFAMTWRLMKDGVLLLDRIGRLDPFPYTNYNFYEGNVVHWEHFYVGIFRCNQVIGQCSRY